MIYTAFHGGSCCGISHVFNLEHEYYQGTPEEIKKKKLLALKEACNKAYKENVSRRYGNFYTPVLLKNKRKEGLTLHSIQVTLAEYQYSNWKPTLRVLGFKKVYEFYNGNSNNMVTVFMKDMNEEYEV